jgi:hypothetical protein
MSDPRRLVNKGEDATAPAQLFSIVGDRLYFITNHKYPAQCDLHEFQDGYSGKAPFAGRSRLIQELAPHIYEKHQSNSASSIYTLIASLKWWWRHFDRVDLMYPDANPVTCVTDISEIHYAHYAHLPFSELPSHVLASGFFALIDTARAHLSAGRAPTDALYPFHWTAIRKPPAERVLIDFEDVKRVYEYLKHSCRDALFRYDAHPAALPTADEIAGFFTLFALQTGWNVATTQDIDVAERRPDGTLDCIEINLMNPNTRVLKTSAVEGDDEGTETSTIRAPKNRAGGAIQRAISRTGPTMGAYNILIRVTQQTEPLREFLRQYHAELTEDLQRMTANGHSGPEIDTIVVELAALERESRSPWVFKTFVGSKMARRGTIIEGVNCLRGSVHVNRMGKSIGALKAYAIDINARLRPAEQRVPDDMNFKDLRDSFISWRWLTSHSWLDAMLAAGHTSRKSLIQYLKRKQIKAQHRRQFVKVGDALWETLRSISPLEKTTTENEPVLITAIAAKVVEVPKEQIVRWLAGKDRTYVGTGCLDFMHPPKSMAPDHQDGTGCKVQRCTLCVHAVLLPSSGPGLARRLVELRYGRRTMPEQAWREGDFHIEMQNTELALEQFDQSEVIVWLTHWETEIAMGRHKPVLSEGTYA